jgi:hypothetical protein
MAQLPYTYKSLFTGRRDGIVRSGDSYTILQNNFIDLSPYLNATLSQTGSNPFGIYQLDNGCAFIKGHLVKESGSDETASFSIVSIGSNVELLDDLNDRYYLGVPTYNDALVMVTGTGGQVDNFSWLHQIDRDWETIEKL